MAKIDELKKASAANGGINNGSTAYGAPTPQSDMINAMYEAQKNARLSELEGAYRQNRSTMEAAGEKIAPAYQQQKNELATQYERNRRNFNQMAAGSGINNGAGSQARLAMSNQYIDSYGGLGRAQAEAEREQERRLTDLEAAYRSDISAALASNDYNRAGALLDEYNNAYQRDMNMAAQLAQYGDFSVYSDLYGKDTADNMRNVWIIQNPDLAYQAGAIDVDRYRGITGKTPIGYVAPGSGGGYGREMGNDMNALAIQREYNKRVMSGDIHGRLIPEDAIPGPLTDMATEFLN